MTQQSYEELYAKARSGDAVARDALLKNSIQLVESIAIPWSKKNGFHKSKRARLRNAKTGELRTQEWVGHQDDLVQAGVIALVETIDTAFSACTEYVHWLNYISLVIERSLADVRVSAFGPAPRTNRDRSHKARLHTRPNGEAISCKDCGLLSRNHYPGDLCHHCFEKTHFGKCAVPGSRQDPKRNMRKPLLEDGCPRTDQRRKGDDLLSRASIANAIGPDQEHEDLLQDMLACCDTNDDHLTVKLKILGLTNDAIATQLDVHPRTIARRISKIKERFYQRNPEYLRLKDRHQMAKESTVRYPQAEAELLEWIAQSA